MKNLILIFYILAATCSTSCRTQLLASKNTVQLLTTSKRALLGVKGPNYRGTIFTENYPFYNLFVSGIDSTNRFTPSVEELEIAENLMHSQLKSMNKRRPNQGSGYPVIHRNLPKYFRQYVGFIDKNGDKIIHINFHWNRYNLIDRINNYIYFNDSRINYESDYSIVMDGGSYYWGINANITQQKLTDLGINGFG